MIQVLLIDRHRLFREALALVLSELPGMAASDQDESLAETGQSVAPVDVALFGSHVSDGVIIRLHRLLLTLNPAVRIVILTRGKQESRSLSHMSTALETVPDTARLEDIIAAVRGDLA